ncbi:MAG: hypothetical protein IJE05_04445 [Clostridia bacterium]|nr:hypothetical protein [Clostridia bacterium]
MTLLTQFNKALKELPSISENLKSLIMIQGWSEERCQQAISIVHQLKKGDLIEKGLCLSYSYVGLSRLTITLSPSECGIDNTTFEPENILQADRYIEKLLADINRISADVKFSLGGHDYENDVCTFDIDWEF